MFSKIPLTPFRTSPFLGLVLSSILLLLALGLGLSYGALELDLWTVWQALVANNNSNPHLVILTVRLPRTLAAICVGASLGVAGALMQALTKNPLASPGLLGINSGAALLVMLASALLGITSTATFTLFALAGAGLAGATVYILSSLGREGMTPVKLVVAGATISILLSSLTQGFLIVRERTLDDMRFWLVGSVVNRNFTMLLGVLPYILVGLTIAFFLGRQITLLALGDDVATGLGLKVGWIKLIAAFVVMLLAGASVALAGPIGFIGLVVPHVARNLVGNDYRWVLPYSAILGSALLLLSDVFARWVIHPAEIPVGAITPLISAPLVIWLIRRKDQAR